MKTTYLEKTTNGLTPPADEQRPSATIILKGDPKSTQTVYRSACRGRFPTRYMTAEGKSLKEQYQWEAKGQWGDQPLQGEVSLSVRFYFKTKLRRDLDNQTKIVLDALTGIVYEDDNQIADLRLTRTYDKENPRMEITVAELG